LLFKKKRRIVKQEKMSELDKIYQGKTKYLGIFDFKEFYRFCYDWLVDHEYLVEERTYSEKIKPTGKEIGIDWICRRKISDYFRFVLKIHWLVLAMTNVEVTKEGKKLTLNKGQPEIGVVGYLEKDYEHRWEATALSKFMRGLYDRYIIKGRIEKYEEKIIEEVDEFIAQAKSFLALEGRKFGG